MREKIGIMVPAFNEEEAIIGCLVSVTNIFPKKDIYVVSDGSTDKTAWRAKMFTDNVLELKYNVGKIKALEQLIAQYDLLQKYEWLVFHDADSKLGWNFFERLEETKMLDNPRIACILGQIQSRRKRSNIFTSARAVQYILGHRIYKKAQGVMKNILVAPGCLSIYRSYALSRLDFENDTVTEDIDLTFQIYRKEIGEIVYDGKLSVTTQDPVNLKSYYGQIKRWHIGFFQNCRKHGFPKFHAVDIEIGLFILESILMFFILGLLPSLLLIFPSIVLRMFLFLLAAQFVISMFAAIILRRFELLLFFPFFMLLQFLECMMFVGAFCKVYFSRDMVEASWKKPDRW